VLESPSAEKQVFLQGNSPGKKNLLKTIDFNVQHGFSTFKNMTKKLEFLEIF
jgi:hypothetical protein